MATVYDGQRHPSPASRMSSTHEQQPIQRTVGRRKPRDGQPMDARDRDAMTALAQYHTRAPKGVFIYYSAEEMERDRLRWTVDAVVERQRRWNTPAPRPGKT